MPSTRRGRRGETYTPAMRSIERVGSMGGRFSPIVVWPVAIALAGTVLTVTVAFTDLQFAVRSAEGRIFLETAQMIIAALVAYLVFGRLGRTGRYRDLLIAVAFAIFALTSLLFIGIRLGGALEDGSQLERVAIWAPLLARVAGTVLLAVAALMGPGRRTRRRSGSLLFLEAVLVVSTTGLATVLMVDRLPAGIADELLLDAARVPGTSAHPMLQLLQLLVVALYAVAAVGLVVRRESTDDPFQVALAAGFTAAAFARLNFYLYPSIYSDVVHLGDFLRLLFFMILLLGGVVEINRYWRVEADAAALRERERLARELHDGLTQELSFIRSQTVAMSKGTMYPEMVELVSAAADRAVSESRALLLTLRGDAQVSLHDVVSADAKRTAGGAVAVTVDVPRGLLVARLVGHELGRVVLEATTNAIRHGDATAIRVEGSVKGSQLTVVITDNGVGFEPSTDFPSKHGLRGIHERAELLGGSAQISSRLGEGTTVTVIVPIDR